MSAQRKTDFTSGRICAFHSIHPRFGGGSAHLGVTTWEYYFLTGFSPAYPYSSEYAGRRRTAYLYRNHTIGSLSLMHDFPS
jgi:hypothetical protein